MPRSIRVAIGTACLIALVGAVSTASWLADAVADGAGTRWLSTTLHVHEGVLRSVSPLYLLAIAVVPIALRRDARKGRIALHLSLLATITLGVMASGALGSAVQGRHLDAALAATLVIPGLIGLLALSLSRPSAKAWFASGERPG